MLRGRDVCGRPGPEQQRVERVREGGDVPELGRARVVRRLAPCGPEAAVREPEHRLGEVLVGGLANPVPRLLASGPPLLDGPLLVSTEPVVRQPERELRRCIALRCSLLEHRKLAGHGRCVLGEGTGYREEKDQRCRGMSWVHSAAAESYLGGGPRLGG